MIIDLPECLPRLRRLLQEANDDGTDLLSVKLTITKHNHPTMPGKELSRAETIEVIARIMGYEADYRAEGHTDELPKARPYPSELIDYLADYDTDQIRAYVESRAAAEMEASRDARSS